MNDVLNQDHQPEELRRVRVDMGTLDRVGDMRKNGATTPPGLLSLTLFFVLCLL
jgi:hypothetical protein